VSDSSSWKQRRTSDTRRTSGSTEPATGETIDAELILSASEISSYAFCPQAWHLQRRGTTRNVAGARSVEQGIVAHRHIGRRADRVLGLERLRRVMLLVVAVLLMGSLFVFLSGEGLLRP
jgi:hypothetical protein